MRRAHAFIFVTFLAAYLPICALGQVPAASSPDLTKYAYMEMQAGRYADAADLFKQRLNADRRDANAAFLYGVALNRMGKFQTASRQFAAFEQAGGKNDEFDYEYGASLAMGKQPGTGKERLTRYKASHPSGVAKADIFLGLIEARMGHGDRAQALWASAQKDPSVAPTALLLLAGDAAKAKDNAKAEVYWQQMKTNYPASSQVKTVEAVSEQIAKAKKP